MAKKKCNFSMLLISNSAFIAIVFIFWCSKSASTHIWKSQVETLNNLPTKIHKFETIHISKTNYSTAWVTHLDGDGGNYLAGAFALYSSIVRLIPNFEDPFILVLVCSAEGLSRAALETLSHTNINLRYLCSSGVDVKASISTNALINWKTLNKLEIFKLKKEYHRLIYVDADLHFLRNPNGLIELTKETGFYAVPSQQDEHRFNSGLFVIVGEFSLSEFERDFRKSLSCKQEECLRYIDRMSKKIDDQGFLNVFYTKKWKPISYYYNMKVMFYMNGKMWGRKNTSIKRDKVIGLHWIGPSKPWKPEINYPCGNTKKYCSCDSKAEAALKFAHSKWTENLRMVSEISPFLTEAVEQQKIQILHDNHRRVKAKTCD